MPLRLPPLSSLRFFEAAGRHQSFKLAAEELNVTPSAASHGIVGLERALGVELFIREPRGLSLTPEGADYLRYVSEAFSLIAIGTQRLPNHRVNRVIAVTCASTLASRWLLPRLHGFTKKWPRIGVNVDTSRRQAGFPVDGFDFAIRMSRAPDASTAGALDGEHALFDFQNDPEEELDVFLTPRDEIMNRYNDFPDYAPVIAELADGMRKAAARIDDDIGAEIADSVLAAVKSRLSKAPTG